MTAAEPPSTTAADHLAPLEQLLDDERTAYGAPGGLILLERDGETRFVSSGFADMAGTEITELSRFRIGSITKPIVASLVLDLVAEGRLTLDQQFVDLVPGVLGPDDPVTVRMLLDHTSGIFNMGDESDPLADIENLEDPALRGEAGSLVESYLSGEQVVGSDRLIVALAETHDRYFAAGGGYHYSNPNYQLAGMVVAAASGMAFADYLEDQVVEPLQLESTSLAPPDLGSPDIHGYAATEDVDPVDLTDDLIAFGNGGGGGVISTAGELLEIMQALVSGRLVDADLVEEMKAPTAQSDESYGLGLATYYLSCGTFFGHGGAVNGTHSIAIVSPDGEDGVVVVFNLRGRDDPELLRLAEELLCSGT